MKYIKIIDPICIVQLGFNQSLFVKGDSLEIVEEKDGFYYLRGIRDTRTTVRLRDKDQYYKVYDKAVYRVVNRLIYKGNIETQQVFSEASMMGDLDIDTETLVLLTGEDFNPKLVSFKQELIVL